MPNSTTTGPQPGHTTLFSERVAMKFIPLWLALICLCGLTGCSTCILTVNGACVSLRDRLKAEKAWLEHWSLYHDVKYRWSFGNGFKAGYVDVTRGGDGAPPDLPPMHYWKSHYQKPKGRRKVISWYDGFTHGALAATHDNASIRHRIPNCGPCEDCTTCGDPAAVGAWDEELLIETPDYFGTEFDEAEPQPPMFEVPATPEADEWRPAPQSAPQPRQPAQPYVEPDLNGERPAISPSGAQKPRRHALPASYPVPKPVKLRNSNASQTTGQWRNSDSSANSRQGRNVGSSTNSGQWRLPFIADR